MGNLFGNSFLGKISLQLHKNTVFGAIFAIISDWRVNVFSKSIHKITICPKFTRKLQMQLSEVFKLALTTATLSVSM